MTDYEEYVQEAFEEEATVLVLDTYSTRFQDTIAQLLKTTQQALCYLEGKQILTFQWMLVFSATT